VCVTDLVFTSINRHFFPWTEYVRSVEENHIRVELERGKETSTFEINSKSFTVGLKKELSAFRKEIINIRALKERRGY